MKKHFFFVFALLALLIAVLQTAFALDFPYATFERHTGPVVSVVFSPEGDTLASASTDNTIRLWDVSSGTLKKTLTGHTGGIYEIVFSPQGNILASASSDTSVRLWDVVTGIHIRKLTGNTNKVTNVVFSPEGDTLASASTDNTIRLWDVSSGTLKKTLTVKRGYSRVFSPDGQLFADVELDYQQRLQQSQQLLQQRAGLDNTIRLWDVSSGTRIKTLTGHKAPSLLPVRIAISPDGNMLASADTIIYLWDISSGTRIKTLTGHTDGVTSIVFSPNGDRLASGSADTTICLWDISSGTRIKTLTGHTSDVKSVVFSPNADRLASGGHESTIHLWKLPSAR